MYGFSDPTIQMLIQELENAEKCIGYEFKNFDSEKKNDNSDTESISDDDTKNDAKAILWKVKMKPPSESAQAVVNSEVIEMDIDSPTVTEKQSNEIKNKIQDPNLEKLL